MALVGGGGAGNTAGSNPTGTGQSLNYIGDHAHGNSGIITTASGSSADTIAFKFTTGNSYFVGTLSIQSDESAGNVHYVTAALDGSIILSWKWDLSASSLATDWPQPILIPPYTNVEVKVGAGDTVEFTAQLVGRVYYA